jgi:hypothetical protein
MELDAAALAINNFSEMIGKPKKDILVNKSTNEQIAAIIKSADNILNEEIDGLMQRFKTTREVFYNEYTSAKRLGGGSARKAEGETPVTTP